MEHYANTRTWVTTTSFAQISLTYTIHFWARHYTQFIGSVRIITWHKQRAQTEEPTKKVKHFKREDGTIDAKEKSELP
jgi:hypothetical protein